jgi:hypothetical protein
MAATKNSLLSTQWRASEEEHFTFVLFSVDGMCRAEAQAASKWLALRLSVKWKQTFLEVCGFIRSHLYIALACSTSLCLRDTRDQTTRKPSYHWNSQTGLGLYR